MFFENLCVKLCFLIFSKWYAFFVCTVYHPFFVLIFLWNSVTAQRVKKQTKNVLDGSCLCCCCHHTVKSENVDVFIWVNFLDVVIDWLNPLVFDSFLLQRSKIFSCQKLFGFAICRSADPFFYAEVMNITPLVEGTFRYLLENCFTERLLRFFLLFPSVFVQLQCKVTMHQLLPKSCWVEC